MSAIKIIGKLNPKQYSEMLDHLTRKKIKNPFIDAEDIVVNKKPEVEQTEIFNRFNVANPRQDMAGGGMLVQPGFGGTRQGYNGRKNRKVSYDTENKIVREYNKYLTDEIKSGNLSKSLGFKSWLRTNKTPAVFEKTYNAHSKNLLDVKPSKLTDAKIGLVKAYVERANEQGQFVEKRRILELIGRTQTPGVAEKNVYVETIIKEINKLDSREDKVHKALNRLFNNELVFVTDPDFYKKFPSDKEAGSITRMLIQETGLTGPTIRQHRATWKKDGSKVPFFSTKKGKEQLKIIEHMNLKMGKVGESTFNGFNFNDLLEYGANSKKGGMYYKKATGSDFYRDPNNVVRQFVVRHFDHNSKFGDKSKLIKVFKKGTNTEVKYEPGKRLIDFDFTYKGKRYGSNELAKEYLKWTRGESTPFKEVYDNHKLYTDFLRKPVNIGDPSVKNIGDLFRLAGHQGMAIEHGALGGVAEEPFKNLKLLSSRANSEIGTILQYYKNFPKVQKLLVNEFIKELPVNENYIDALAKNEIKIAKDMLKNGNTTIPMTYNQAAKNILTNKNIKNFSPTELLTVSKSAFGPDIGYRSFVGVKPEKFENITTQKQLQKLIASFGDGACAVQFGKTKKDGGRIGYATGPVSLSSCLESGAKNFNDGKLKTADQVQDAAKLLRGGRAVISGLMKYGIIPELAYVGLEAAGRTLLGEKPTNSLLKSIDTLTFGATDFGSGIEAEKFGKFSDQKLAVDKFRNSQALVNSLQSKLKNLEDISSQGGEGYIGDLTSDIQMTQAQLQKAQKALQENTVSSDIIQFIDRKGQEIADTQMAKSDFAKQSLKDQMEGIPGIRDYTDTESTRIFPKQPSQMDLNLTMFPTLPTDIMQLKTSDAIDLAQKLRAEGQNVSAKEILAYRDDLKQMPLSKQAEIYGDEQVYGTQGADVLQPLAGGGIAKLAGDRSGPPPEKGPMSQGLQGLMKRVRNL